MVHAVGVDISEAESIYDRARALRNLTATGVSCHIGSQIVDLSAFLEALQDRTVTVGKTTFELPAFSFAIATMNPILSADTASSRITGLIYDNLIQPDPKTGEPKPRVATFSVSQDALTYSYEINAKANWSDGKPIIAQDWFQAKAVWSAVLH